MTVELIIDNCSYEFDLSFDVLDKNKPLQINISTNKIGNGDFLTEKFFKKILIHF